MPRSAVEVQYVTDFGPDCFSTDGEVLTCEVCGKPVNATKKYYVQQHINGSGHARRLEARQSLIEERSLSLSLSQRESGFSFDLCRMMVESNIPLFKVQHSSFANFMQKYCKNEVPNHTTLRKTYLVKLYQETIEKIRSSIGQDRIWISIDETTDVKGQFVVNTVIGCLNAQRPSFPFLINSEIVDRTNHTTVAQAFMNALVILWPDGVHHDRVLLCVSDAASYMKKAGEALRVLFPKLIHVTCLAHGIHRLCEEIRGLFPRVDSLIANVKKVFLKAPARIHTFRSIAPNVALPPEPVITRWGTWLTAALYYATHFEVVREVVNQLDSSGAVAIAESQNIMRDSRLPSDLAFIATNFANFPVFIKMLEDTSQPLHDTVSLLRDIERCVGAIAGSRASPIKEKFQRILHSNPGLSIMCEIESSHQGGHISLTDFSIEELASFRYAPIVSVDVERSFSTYKNLLSDRRHSLTVENAKFHLITMCNNFGRDS
ncbi:uncharacterized protein LOC100907991 [Galendromus occidentalis]|uniref:Uncharacterized protein LOC100907991 n=1 Tax=Galendromus occidentalis TaxID=34638 RepID=A0AAJ6QU63_9ACAR|nr:uncharacterized protein LOC100907991 [Galendromus occidentalis]